MMEKEVYIIEGKRTAQGSFLGNFAQMSAPCLASKVMEDLLAKTSTNWEQIDQVILGQVLQAGVGQAPARQAALFANAPQSIPCTTVNKVCGSGLEAILIAAQRLMCQADSNKMMLAGGMENMSLAPVALLNTRVGMKLGAPSTVDLLSHDGLLDPYSKNSMGLCAEECAKKYNFTRSMQDEYAANSYKKAMEANKLGHFKAEITPIIIKDKKGDMIIEKDQGLDSVDFEKMKKIPCAFDRVNGTITAANASTINDGAAVILLGGKEFQSKAKFKIRSYAYHAQNPLWFSTAPIESMQKAIKFAKLKLEDIDLFEINEAFSVVPMACIHELKIPEERVNIFGGAVALGHPLGASGARIVVTLMNALEKRQKKFGLASLCIGGGEGLSMIIEKIK